MKTSLFTICICCVLLLSHECLLAQGTGQNFPFSSYEEFDLEGGYDPGSIIIVKNKSAQSPIYTIKELSNSYIKDKSLSELSSPVKIPSTVLDRKKNFMLSLDSKSKYEQLPAEMKSNLDKVKNVLLKVNDGERINLKKGSSVLTDIIFALPKQALERVLFELKNKNKMYMISEVIQYNDATLTFSWVTNFNTDLQTDIQKSINLGVGVKWVDNSTLEVKFKPNNPVGYKAIKISGKYIKLLRERLEYRNKFGDDKVYFQDKDKDGYGDKNVCVAQVKKPDGFVENGLDCDDNNSLVNPGQNKFFATPRVGGSFDYNCDGAETKEFTSIGQCDGGCHNAAPQGWTGGIAGCGQNANWLTDCDFRVSPRNPGCNKATVVKTQSCN